MKKEKDILLKYLCMALPYGVMMGNKEWPRKPYQLTCGEVQYAMMTDDWDDAPYLRPMSSMTKKEIYDFASKFTNGLPHDIDVERGFCHVTCIDLFNEIEVDFSIENIVDGFYGVEGYELLLAHHFDFMGLIPMDCAIEVTEDNNPYKD